MGMGRTCCYASCLDAIICQCDRSVSYFDYFDSYCAVQWLLWHIELLNCLSGLTRGLGLGRISYLVGQRGFTGRHMLMCCSMDRLVAKSSQFILSQSTVATRQHRLLLA
jgi:hypothetical protein